MDRCFLYGDVVAPIANPTGQNGTVTDVTISADVQWLKSGHAATLSTKSLQHICPIKLGSFVVNGAWLGRVEECLDTVYVRFSDGATCKIAETNLDELEPVEEIPLIDDDHPYFPGLKVRRA